MTWLLCLDSPREPELLEFFFAVLGRSLYVANAYEFKCRDLLRLLRLGKVCELGNDLDAAIQLTSEMKEKMLDGTLQELSTIASIKPRDIELLDEAKDARNFIAHESGNIGFIRSTTEQDLAAQLEKLRTQIKALAEGDNIVSRWQYNIQEKEPAPYGMCQTYPTVLVDWVFGGPSSFDPAISHRSGMQPTLPIS